MSYREVTPPDPEWRSNAPATGPQRIEQRIDQSRAVLAHRVDALESAVAKLQGDVSTLTDAINEMAGWLAALQRAGERTGTVVDALVEQAQRAGWDIR